MSMTMIKRANDYVNDKSLKIAVKSSIAFGGVMGLVTEGIAGGVSDKTKNRFSDITGEKVVDIKGTGDLDKSINKGGSVAVGALLSIATVIGVFLVFIAVLQFRKIKDGNSDVSMASVATKLTVGILLIILAPLIAWLTGAGGALLSAVTQGSTQ